MSVVIDSVPSWAAQDVTLPLWAVLVLSAYSNRRIVSILRRARSGLPKMAKKESSQE